MKKRVLRLLAAAAAFLPAVAIAAPQDTFNVTGTQSDGMVSMIQAATQGWFAKLFPLADGVFFALVGVEIFYFLVMTVLNRRDPDYFIPELLKKTMGIGFFLAILLNAGPWMSDLINGFQYAGSQAAGVGTLTPGSIIGIGAETAWKIVVGVVNLYQTMVASSFNPITILTETVEYLVLFGLSLIVASVFFIAFCMIAIELFVTLIETYIVIGASVLFLGLGGSRWTSSYVHKVIGYGVSVGTKLFFLYLIVGLIVAPGSGVVSQMQSQVTAMDAALAAGGSNFVDVAVAALGFYFYFVFVAFVLAIAAKRVPAFAASLLGGASSMTGGEVAGPAVALGAAVATGGAAVALGAKAGLSAVANAAGGQSAGSVSAAATKATPQVSPPSFGGSSTSGGSGGSSTSGASGGQGTLAAGKADQVSPPSGGGQATAAAKGPSASGSGPATGKDQVSPPASGQTSQGTATQAASPASGGTSQGGSSTASPASGGTGQGSASAGTPASGGTGQSSAASGGSSTPASGAAGTPAPATPAAGTTPSQPTQPAAPKPASQTPNTNAGTQGSGSGSRQVSPPSLDEVALGHAKKAIDAITTHDGTTVGGGTSSGGHLGSE